MYTDEWRMIAQPMGVRKFDLNNSNNKTAKSSDTAVNIHDRNIGDNIGMYDGERTKAEQLHHLPTCSKSTTLKLQLNERRSPFNWRLMNVKNSLYQLRNEVGALV